MYKEFLLDNGKIIYKEELDGGGTSFGINALKDSRVKNIIKKGSILEMCSGPGFMGFYLKFEGFAEKLYLSDINSIHKEYIENTINKNSLKNVEFIQSDGFDGFDKNLKFDTIVINPPHYTTPIIGGYNSKQEELMCLDFNMELHKKFIKNAKHFLNKDGVILIIGNMGGITPDDIIACDGFDYIYDIVACERFGWIRDSRFYVMKLTNNVH